jgi:hypothetical protein
MLASCSGGDRPETDRGIAKTVHDSIVMDSKSVPALVGITHGAKSLPVEIASGGSQWFSLRQ